jgi:hypothetical protein
MRFGTFSKRVFSVSIAAAAAVTTLGTVAAQASPVPPVANSSLPGTWVNTNSATRSVKQVVITRGDGGRVSVDAFGSCSPSLCEWGLVPAIVYGPTVSSTTGNDFQSNQRFLNADGSEWSRTVLMGHLSRTTAGLRLSLKELTVFEDGSGRHNYRVNETFQPGEGQQPTKAGNAVSGYPIGAPPAPNKAIYGNWKNTSASPAVDTLSIAPSGNVPQVHAFGKCSPSDCDMGTVKGITYGVSISSTVGNNVLAPFSFGFKNEQLLISYGRAPDGTERLTVSNYNEFTDGSGRSNYVMTETFVRA